MKPINLRSRILMFLPAAGLLTLLAGAAASPPSVARVVIWRKINTVSPAESFYQPIDSAKPAAAGFMPVGDYAPRTLFRGPKSAVSQLIADLRADGFDAESPRYGEEGGHLTHTATTSH